MPRFKLEGVKALSVNEAYFGKKTKTTKYRRYEENLLFLLPPLELPEPPYILKLEWGLSNSNSDGDNPVKPFQDILATKYKFNDRQILKWVIEKQIVKKGEEYIIFELKTLIKNEKITQEIIQQALPL